MWAVWYIFPQAPTLGTARPPSSFLLSFLFIHLPISYSSIHTSTSRFVLRWRDRGPLSGDSPWRGSRQTDFISRHQPKVGYVDEDWRVNLCPSHPICFFLIFPSLIYKGFSRWSKSFNFPLFLHSVLRSCLPLPHIFLYFCPVSISSSSSFSSL